MIISNSYEALRILDVALDYSTEEKKEAIEFLVENTKHLTNSPVESLRNYFSSSLNFTKENLQKYISKILDSEFNSSKCSICRSNFELEIKGIKYKFLKNKPYELLFIESQEFIKNKYGNDIITPIWTIRDSENNVSLIIAAAYQEYFSV